MLNIAIALAFILSVLFKPAQLLLDLVIGLPVVGILPLWERLFVMVIFDLWFPAVLIYLALKIIPCANKFRPTGGENAFLFISNLIFLSIACISIYASLIPGGGIGLLVGLVVFIPKWFALIGSSIVLIKILIRKPEVTYPDPHDGATNLTWRDKFISLAVIEKASIGIVGFLPVTIAMGFLIIGQNSPAKITYKNYSRMNELCSTAGEKIFKVLKNVDGLYWDNEGGIMVQIPGVGYKPFFRGRYQGGHGSAGDELAWVRGRIYLYIEKPNRPRDNNDPQNYKYIRYTNTANEYASNLQSTNKEYVNYLLSTVGIIRTRLSNKDDEKFGLESYEIAVRVLATGEITATNRFTYNKKTGQFCGQVDANSNCEMCFINRAIDWQFH